MHKLVRVTTAPVSLKVLLKGQLKFMQQNGFEVIAVSSDGTEINELKSQENCYHFILPLTRKISPVADLICIYKLYLLLKKVKPTIIHSHTPKAGLVSMLAGYFASVPIRVHTIAGVPWLIEKGIKKSILKQVEKLTIKASSKAYVNSKNLKLLLECENVVSSKLSVIGNGTSNGIDANYFTPDKNIIEQSRFLMQQYNSDYVWLFVGRIVKDKGIQELLLAFVELHKVYPNDQLWLVGEEEPHLDPINEDSKAILSSNKNIIKFGFQKDVRPFYNAAQTLVFPSYREGFPNVPMQAALMNCSLILSNINGCNEIVEHNKTGLLVESNNYKDLLEKMVFARSNQSVMEDCRIAAKQFVINNFSQQVVWKNLLNEYNQLIKQYAL